jgi:transcriptional regulator with XRE-family HTH domain
VTGKELAKLRKKLGLTQAQLAERIGIAPNSLARLERGERKIAEPIARLVKLLLQIELGERVSINGLY